VTTSDAQKPPKRKPLVLSYDEQMWLLCQIDDRLREFKNMRPQAKQYRELAVMLRGLQKKLWRV
jgi:hypothetical protein